MNEFTLHLDKIFLFASALFFSDKVVLSYEGIIPISTKLLLSQPIYFLFFRGAFPLSLRDRFDSSMPFAFFGSQLQ